MKKTLAAVLAAAMALSTSMVALAKDYSGEIDMTGQGKDVGSDTITKKDAVMGDTSKYVITSIELDDGNTISGDELARAMAEGQIVAKVVVTDGLNKLSGLPTLTGGNYLTKADVQSTSTFNWVDPGDLSSLQAAWAGVTNISSVGDPADMNAGDEIEFVCVKADKVTFATTTDEVKYVYEKGTSAYKKAVENSANSDYVNKVTTTSIENVDAEAVRISFKINHTYGTDKTTIAMKFRFTVKKGNKAADGSYGKTLTLGDKTYNKGDTLTSKEVKFEGNYYELSNYYRDMQLTKEERDDRRVILDGTNLYDAIGDSTFTIYFADDVAAFSAKASSTQKKVNLWYDLGEIAAVTDAYPDVDFEFITFKGSPSVTTFVNSGTMTFNAIGGKNTQVYKLETSGGGDDGDTLVPLDFTYDSTYNTVTVKGIKRLSGTFVVASEILEVEDDEDYEPVNSAPVVEEPSSQPSSNDGERNPSTGAC